MFRVLRNQRGGLLFWIAFFIGVISVIGFIDRHEEKMDKIANKVLYIADKKLDNFESNEANTESGTNITTEKYEIECMDGYKKVIIDGKIYTLSKPDDWGDYKPIECGE